MQISEMKTEVLSEVDRLEKHLASTRKLRDQTNAEIKQTLTDLAEAKRFAKAFEKRTRKSK